MPTFPVPSLSDGRRAFVSSGYGPRDSGFHAGVDLTFHLRPYDFPKIEEVTVSKNKYWHPKGLPAINVMDGEVITAQVTSTGGHIHVKHADGWSSQHIHLKPGSFRVKVGQFVKEGQPIAEISGNISGKPPGQTGLIHDHFQLRKDGNLVDPEPIIANWEHIPNPWQLNLVYIAAAAAVIYLIG